MVKTMKAPFEMKIAGIQPKIFYTKEDVVMEMLF